MHDWLRKDDGIKSQEYLPDLWLDVNEMKALTESEDTEFRRLNREHGNLLDDAFVLTAGDDAITRRERMIQIRADRQAESLDFRRIRLINRYSMRDPFTIRWLEKQIRSLMGGRPVEIRRDVNNFFIEIAFDIKDYPYIKEFIYTLEQTVPLNMGCRGIGLISALSHVYVGAAYFETTTETVVIEPWDVTEFDGSAQVLAGAAYFESTTETVYIGREV